MTVDKRIHVVPDDNGWAVKREGSERASKLFDTQGEAEAFAKEMAKREGGEVVIHGRDGKIRDSDSFGHDPNPPRDTRG